MNKSTTSEATTVISCKAWPEEGIRAGEHTIRLNGRARVGQIIAVHLRGKGYICKLIQRRPTGITILAYNGKRMTFVHDEIEIIGVIKRAPKRRPKLTTARRVENELNQLNPKFSIQTHRFSASTYGQLRVTA
jgi:hypothetical protein